MDAIGREIDTIAASLGDIPEAEPGEPGYIINTWERVVTACRAGMRPVASTEGLRLAVAIGHNLKTVELSPARDAEGRSYLNLRCGVGRADLIDVTGLAGWVFETFSLGDVRIVGEEVVLHLALRMAGLPFSRLTSMVKFLVVAAIDATAVFVRGLDNVPPTKDDLFGPEAVAGAGDILEDTFSARPEMNPFVGNAPGDADQFTDPAGVDTRFDELLGTAGVYRWNGLVSALAPLLGQRDAAEAEYGFGATLRVDGNEVPVVMLRNALVSGADSAAVTLRLGDATAEAVREAARQAAALPLGGVVVHGTDLYFSHAFEISGQRPGWIASQIEGAARCARELSGPAGPGGAAGQGGPGSTGGAR